MMSQKSNQMMTQSWKNEKEGQGDSLVSPLGISMTWKVNLKEEGFSSLVFFLTVVSEDRAISAPLFVTLKSERESGIKMTAMENMGMPLQ